MSNLAIYGPGNRILVGRNLKPGTVCSVGDRPEITGFVHEVLLDSGEKLSVAGDDIKPFPELEMSKKKRFAVGAKVRIIMPGINGVITHVSDTMGVMGEYWHTIATERGERRDPGSNIELIPELIGVEPTRRNSTTIHIRESNVANLNVGTQVGDINTVLNSISSNAGAGEFVSALRKLTEAVKLDTALAADVKQEIFDQLATLAEQGAKKPEERSMGTLKAVVKSIPTAISAVNGLVTLWHQVGPHISGYFGF